MKWERPRKVKHAAKTMKLYKDENMNDTSFSSIQVDEDCKNQSLTILLQINRNQMRKVRNEMNICFNSKD